MTPEPAQTVVFGRIATMSAPSEAEALAIRDGRIVSVGSRAEVEARIVTATRCSDVRD